MQLLDESLPVDPLAYTVLILESSADQTLYRRFLLADSSCRYTLLEVDSVATAAMLCQTTRIDAILVDAALQPPYLESFQDLQTRLEECRAPIVVVASESDPAVVVRLIKLGAEDYLLKQTLTPEQLQVAMRTAIENARLRLQLQHQEERFRISVENMLDCFGIFSALRDQQGQIVDFRIDYLNKAACENNQMPREQQIGQRLCEILPAHRETGLFDAYCRVVETGEPLRESLVYEDDYNGQRLARTFDIHANKLDDGFVASWRDVTARQREQRLRESEERLQLGVQVAGVGLAHFDYASDQVTLSPEAAALYGFATDQPDRLVITRTQIHDTFHPEERDTLLEIIRQVLNPAGAGWFAREHRVVWPTGEVRWLNVRKQVFFDASETPRPVYAILAAVDITDRKRIEAQLQENEQRLKAIIDNSRAAIFVKDLQGRYLLMNRACEQLFQVTNDWMQGKTDYDLFPADIASVLQTNDRQVLETGEALTLEEDIPLEDGIHTYVSVKFPLFDSNGVPYAVCGISTDISDRVRLQAERSQLLAEAEAARAAAEAANRSKDDFVSLVAHELRSPLNAIMGWAQLLQARPFDAATAQKALDTIIRNTQAQVQLVEDLLDVSRMVRGSLRLTMAPVNLVAVIESAIETVRPTAEAKGLQIETRLTGLEAIFGDFQRLQQVVLNLLTNAIKFTPASGRVRIWLEQQPAHAQIQISDTGKGISPDFLPHIFEQFQQDQQNATTRQGLGLGLAIVKYIVEQHGGIVTAQSRGEGQGATFTVLLPLFREIPASNEDAVELVPPALADPMAPSLSDLRILLVDDDRDMLDLATVILTQAGAVVQTATSAAMALEQLTQFQPNLLISDIAMPEQNGYDLLRQIRSIASADSIPAIALTAYAGEAYQEDSFRAGFAHHLVKPVEPEALVQVILSLMQSRPQAG